MEEEERKVTQRMLWLFLVIASCGLLLMLTPPSEVPVREDIIKRLNKLPPVIRRKKWES